MNMRRKLIILFNFIISVNVILIALIGILCGAGDGQLGNYIIGWGYLKPYTMESNILLGIVALLVVLYSLKQKDNDTNRFPGWLMRTYLMGTTSLVLTFLIAAGFLAPMQVMSGRNYFIMFSGDMFFFHFLNPLLATVSLTVLFRDAGFSFRDRFVGMLPTVLYSVLYFTMVVVLKWWDDFYNFTFGGKYYLIPVVLVVIYGIAYLCSYMLTGIHNQNTGNSSIRVGGETDDE